MKRKLISWLKEKLRKLMNWAMNGKGYLDWDQKKGDYDYKKRVR